MREAVVYLFPQGRYGYEGYRGIDDRFTATQIDEIYGSWPLQVSQSV